jgi:hypothetical protein
MNATLRTLTFLTLTALLAACSTAASSAAPPTSGPPVSETPIDSPAPGGGGGSEPGVGAPGLPDSELVEPQPGQQNVMSVPLERLEAAVDGRTVTITAHWSSGVAPCSVLDQVLINAGDGTLDVTIREGTSDPEAMCVLMLQAKHTIVQLELEAGTWVIRDTEGGAGAIEVTVS